MRTGDFVDCKVRGVFGKLDNEDMILTLKTPPTSRARTSCT